MLAADSDVTLSLAESEASELRTGTLAGGERLALSTASLTCTPAAAAAASVSLRDCVGAAAEGGILTVHSAPFTGGGSCCGGAASRKLGCQRFDIGDATLAEAWAVSVRNAMMGRGPDASVPPAPRWLVLINPVSGARLGQKIMARCRPLFVAAGVVATEVVTTHSGHAGEMVAALALDEYDAVITVGGDGVLYEAVNALMARADADVAAARLALGVLPAGSGNGVATSLLRAAGEPLDALSMAFQLVRGRAQPLDLWRVTQADRVGYGFLSLEWAMASDIDLGSEKWRWMGPIRFDLYALLRLVTQWRYKGTLRMRERGTTEWKSVDGTFVMLWAMNLKWPSTEVQLAPRADFADGLADVLVVQRVARGKMIRAFLDLSSGAHADKPWFQYYKVEEFEIDPEPRTRRQPGYLAIDGEEWPLARTSVLVLPRKLTLLGGA